MRVEQLCRALYQDFQEGGRILLVQADLARGFVKHFEFVRALLGLRQQAGIIDCAGRVGGKERQQVCLLLGELARRIALFGGGQHADQFARIDHRHFQDGAQAAVVVLERMPLPRLIILDDHGLS